MKSPVVKNILAAVAGYVAMFVLVFAAFSAMWMILGADGSFEPGTWEVTTAWLGTSVVVALLAAVSGGFVCSKLAANHHAVAILIGLVVVLGIASGIPDGPAVVGPRPDGVSMMDAMTTGNQPRWIVWLNPVLGAIGVVLGAKLQAKKSA